MSDTDSKTNEPARQVPHDDQQGLSHHVHSETDLRLEVALSHVFQQQAAQVRFPPALRDHIVSHLPSRHSQRTQRRLALGLAGTLVAVLVLLLALFLWLPLRPLLPAGQTLSYQIGQTIPVPLSLSQGVSILALDPTGHHLVYQPSNQPGVMYTADLANPIASNVLAMLTAHTARWAPDGSALVTTVTPVGTTEPLLALVPFGKYMYPLGPTALAADWSPTGDQQITYITQGKGSAALWVTTQDGQSARLLAKMALTLPVQRMLWSPDGRHLAFVVTTSGYTGAAALMQPGRAIYLMDRQSGRLQELVTPGDFTIGDPAWSPDSHLLTYEHFAAQEGTSLQAINIATAQPQFTIPIHHTLAGWSWSPNSHALIYSDGGVLQVYSLSGPRLILPSTRVQQTFPTFLHDGQIFLLQSTSTGSELVLLHPQKA